MYCSSAALGQNQQWVPSVPPGLLAMNEDLLDLRRGNLLLEREKLSLEIQILRQKMAKISRGEDA